MTAPEICIADQFRSFPDDEQYLQRQGIGQRRAEDNEFSSPLFPPKPPLGSQGEGTPESPISFHYGSDNGAEKLDDDVIKEGPGKGVSNYVLQLSIMTRRRVENDDLVTAYLKLICHNHNTLRPLPSSVLPRYMWFSSEFWSPIRDQANHLQGVANPPAREVCWGTRMLANFARENGGGKTKEDRRKELSLVEHIFISISRDSNIFLPETGLPQVYKGLGRQNFGALLVISPQIKMVEYFDCKHSDGTQFIYCVLEWLKYELGAGFTLEEWSYRQNDCAHHNPPGTTHDHTYIFGLHSSCIHAFNVAFGLHVPGEGRNLLEGNDVQGKRIRVAVELIRGQFNFRQDGEEEPVMYRNHYLGKQLVDGEWLDSPVVSGTRPPHLKASIKMTRRQYCMWAEKYRRDITPTPLIEQDDEIVFLEDIRGGNDARQTVLDIIYGMQIPDWKDLLFEDGWTIEMLKLRIYRFCEDCFGIQRLAWEALSQDLPAVLRSDQGVSMDEYRRTDLWDAGLLKIRMYQYYDEELGGHRKLWDSVQ